MSKKPSMTTSVKMSWDRTHKSLDIEKNIKYIIEVLSLDGMRTHQSSLHESLGNSTIKLTQSSQDIKFGLECRKNMC